MQRVQKGLGGSHTVVTYPPLDALSPVAAEDVIAEIQPSPALNLYAHIAFCEHICPFCHYATKKAAIDGDTEEIRTYLDALSGETAFWRERLQGSDVQSIYIGGGTPTVVSTDRLLRVISDLKNISNTPPSQICIETSPLTTTADGGREKLEALIAAGVNRISTGLQSFDETVLQRSRGHGQSVALKAMETLTSLGTNLNVDFIQDLPGQTDQSIKEDIRLIDHFQPQQVTWYLFRLHRGSIWHNQLLKGKFNELIAQETSVARRRLIRERMLDIGYTPMPGGRFVKGTLEDHYKKVRGGTATKLLGIGASAYSHGWGHFFRNVHNADQRVTIRQYIETVSQNGHAIISGHKMDDVEYLAASIISGIRSEIVLPAPTQETGTYLASVNAILNELAAEDLTEQTPSGAWRLTMEGQNFEEEICSLFYTPAIQQKLQQAEEWWLRDQPSQDHL